MNNYNIDSVIKILNSFINLNSENKDIERIKVLINNLLDINGKLISLNELEIIKSEIVYFETSYDFFNELSNYFDPVYISIKKQIHNNMVNKVREKNRKKFILT